MLCWRRESLSHLDLTTHTNNMSVRGVRLSTFNLLQRISNYAFSNTFCGCSRVRTSVCYHRHGCNVPHRTTQMVSPPRTPYTHPYFCGAEENRTLPETLQGSLASLGTCHPKCAQAIYFHSVP